MTAVRLSGVSKAYGRIQALNDLSLEIPRGCVCGVVGPNGSGKTTLFAAIAGLVPVDRGQINVLGQGAYQASKMRGRLGLMPQDSLPSPHASIRQSLMFYAELQGLEKPQLSESVDNCLQSVRMTERANSRFSELSHGMKRRFSIAAALLGEPELILLDEPTAGLDPELAFEMRKLFLELRGRATLVVSSHVLSELEEICDYIVILEQGRLVKQGTLSGLAGPEQRISVELAAPPDLVCLNERLAEGLVFEWQSPTLTVRFAGDWTPQSVNAAVLPALIEQGLGIVRVELGQSLERSYLATRSGRSPR